MFRHSQRSWRSGDLTIYGNTLRFGGACEGHRHDFGHSTFIMSGVVLVTLIDHDDNRTDQEFRAPAEVFIPAGVIHRVQALSLTAEFWCVFSDEAQRRDMAACAKSRSS